MTQLFDDVYNFVKHYYTDLTGQIWGARIKLPELYYGGYVSEKQKTPDFVLKIDFDNCTNIKQELTVRSNVAKMEHNVNCIIWIPLEEKHKNDVNMCFVSYSNI